MSEVRLEHVNVNVSDPERVARLMEELFDWRVRWRGPARDGKLTIHIGSANHYLALHGGGKDTSYAKGHPLNHIGVEVDDLADTERRVIAAGLKPFGHDKYDPGERFYFLDHDGTEFEVVSYR
ncbi:MAG TPA: VOC family protein [Reyranella sp.]|nr:VOC family protein [Reyranella sp.]